jgi:hypothetical protein
VRDNPTRTTVRLRDIRASDNNDGVGISISAENVSVKNTIVENHNDGGMRISAGSTGTVTIRNSTFSDNGDRDPQFPDDGIYIKSTQSVDIENVESYNNDESGIDIDSGKSISIKQVETYSNGEFRGSLEAGPFPGITIENTDAIDGGRTIELTDVRSTENGFGNIILGETADRDTAILRNVTSGSTGDNHGIEIKTEKLVAKEITASNSNDGGLFVNAGDEGNISIQNGTFSDNGDEDPEFPDDGVYIKSTQSVDIENVESYNNDESGIDIDSGKSISIKQVETYSNGEFRGSLEAGPFPGITIENTDAIDGGRTIELTDVRSTENGFGNIILGETADRDTAILRNVTSGSTGDNHGIEIKTEKLVAKEITASNSNDGGLFVNAGDEGNISIQNGTFSDNGDEDPEFPDDGVHIVSVESINIENSKLTNNDESGVDIPSDVQSGNITHSTILNNDGPEIINRGTDVIGARNNWWGDPAGPPEDEIRGNVAVGSPLSIPPGDDDSNSPTTVQLTNATISPTEVATDGSTHTLSFDVSNLSTDDQPDNFTITLPNNLTVDNANIEEAGGLSPDIRTSDNPITFSVDPVSPIQNPVNIRVELTLSQSSE